MAGKSCSGSVDRDNVKFLSQEEKEEIGQIVEFRKSLASMASQELTMESDGAYESDPENKLSQFEEISEHRIAEGKKVAEEMNMYYLCENGQRIIGPPKGWNLPVPPQGSEIHVGHLPRSTTETSLMKIFCQAGEIYTLRLMISFSGDNRGFCFVKYTTPGAAEKAIKMFNELPLEDKFLKIQLSIENRRIFIRPLPMLTTEEELYEEVGKHLDGLIRIVMRNSPRSAHFMERFGFLDFIDHRSAALARKKFIEGQLNFRGQDLYVDWALPIPSSHLPRTLRITNVEPNEAVIPELVDLMNERTQNGVVSMRLKYDTIFAKMDSNEKARLAKDTLNGFVFRGIPLHIDWKNKRKVRFIAFDESTRTDTREDAKHLAKLLAQAHAQNAHAKEYKIQNGYGHGPPATGNGMMYHAPNTAMMTSSVYEGPGARTSTMPGPVVRLIPQFQPQQQWQTQPQPQLPPQAQMTIRPPPPPSSVYQPSRMMAPNGEYPTVILASLPDQLSTYQMAASPAPMFLHQSYNNIPAVTSQHQLQMQYSPVTTAPNGTHQGSQQMCYVDAGSMAIPTSQALTQFGWIE